MIDPISPAVQAAAVPQTIKATPKPSQAKATATTGDSVQISAMAAILEELQETPAETAEQARNGDPQAIRRLAREEAESYKPTVKVP